MPSATPPFDVAGYFADLVRGLCAAVAEHFVRDRTAEPLLWTVCRLLQRKAVRFDAILARFRAGTLKEPCPRGQAARPAADRPPGPAHYPGLSFGPVRLPRRGAWLVGRMGWTVAAYASRLTHLMAQPETAALLAASPQAERLLRSIWPMLCAEPFPAVARERPQPSSAAPIAAACDAERPASGCAGSLGSRSDVAASPPVRSRLSRRRAADPALWSGRVFAA